MQLGYNTNGFAHHTLPDTLTILSELGYDGIALTLEREHLDPPDRRGVTGCIDRLRLLLEAVNFRVTIETGSRFILDRRKKHQPTLISASHDGRRRRVDFLAASIDVAAALSAESVSLWSGAADDEAGEPELWDRLVSSLRDVLRHAESRGVRLSFEPEPAMFVDSMARYAKLYDALDHPLFGLTLDVGHVHCLSDGDLAEHVRRWRDVLWNVHIDDARRGVHEHLMFGEGQIDFAGVFDALREIDYGGPVHVELPRHSHDAVEVARRSHEFLRRFIARTP